MPTSQQILVVATFLLLVVGWPLRTYAQNLSDPFELKTVWSVFNQHGHVGLSTEVKRSLSMSLKLTSRPGGQRWIWVAHPFATPKNGTLSVWFYDTSPGTETLYSGLTAIDHEHPELAFGVNVADWSPLYYVWGHPYLGETITNVRRTAGWHEFKLVFTGTRFDALIDGVVVGSVPGNFKFDEVRLFLSGPYWRPDATFYFDDFRFQELR